MGEEGDGAGGGGGSRRTSRRIWGSRAKTQNKTGCNGKYCWADAVNTITCDPVAILETFVAIWIRIFGLPSRNIGPLSRQYPSIGSSVRRSVLFGWVGGPWRFSSRRVATGHVRGYLSTSCLLLSVAISAQARPAARC